MVSRPLQIARVGERTFSITRLYGSSTPLANRFWRRAMISSNLEKRSPAGLMPSLMVWRSLLILKLCHRIDKLAEILDLGLLVHADDDVELVFDRRHEIHHSKAVEFKVDGKSGCAADLDALLVERFGQRTDGSINFGTVHKGVLFTAAGEMRLACECGAKKVRELK